MKKKRYLGISAAVLFTSGFAFVGSASASMVFGSNTPEGFVTSSFAVANGLGATGLAGASEFGLSDAAGGPACPLCDSVVNFTTYSNPDHSDWRFDIQGLTGIPVASWLNLASDPGAEGGDDANAFNDRWVFFYQIQNTDPLNVANSDLENFNVTKTQKDGDPFEKNAYANGGYNNNAAAISPFNPVPGLDVPNDWQPAEYNEQVLVASVNGRQAPQSLFFTDASGPNPIASPSVRAGAQAYSGALFEFGPGTNDLINPLEFSEVLWLSSNARTAGIIWAETESPGGFGTAGDVAGIKNVPEPGVLALYAVGLAGLGFVRRRKRSNVNA